MPARLPGQEPTIPSPRGYVNDFAGVIDAATAARLERLAGELESKTGAEIAVVTVETSAPLSAFDQAMKIAESWKPGAPGKDNGVVFLVAVKDRELFILTGYGVEGPLPDGRVGEIRDRLVVPRFRKGDYGGGIRAGTEEIVAILAQEYGVVVTGAPAPVSTLRRPTPSPVLMLLLLAAVLIVLLAMAGRLPMVQRQRGLGGTFGGSFGGGGFGGSGGGFGGFGGGSFGGGGAGGRW